MNDVILTRPTCHTTSHQPLPPLTPIPLFPLFRSASQPHSSVLALIMIDEHMATYRANCSSANGGSKPLGIGKSAKKNDSILIIIIKILSAKRLFGGEKRKRYVKTDYIMARLNEKLRYAKRDKNENI